ncbi:hypothetical protein FAUST_6239 [Fusarium austroamericanum]|uniref:LysM domain-containing protein n=1 Tax=Fusarium austroamericanum TaxID=282268 RepID=A0AAN5ZAE0_FUSAU|nr:hypothetical protein FAUST_6239 [Fusarium austroamericanum]
MVLLGSLAILAFSLCKSANAFKIYNPDVLNSDTFGEACVQALGAEIDCHKQVRSFMERRWHSSLQSTNITDQVFASNCDSKNFDGEIPTLSGGLMWAGWNETCVKDPKTKRYCNEIMDEFTEVDSLEKLPSNELCHICHIRRLAMMQSSQYSAYNDFYKGQLEYVYKTCGGRAGPTEVLPPLTPKETVPRSFCSTDKYYVTQEGDTCDSISKTSRVSGAMLYMGNQELIRNCHEVPGGMRLCLPLECKTYVVKPEDTCISIENSFGLELDTLRFYNSWIDHACENLHISTDFYGKSICVSPQGGVFTEGVPESRPTPNPSRGDGYSHEPVAPPENAKVAEKTTRNCGNWHVVKDGDTCTSICMQGNIEAELFHDVNPSLKAGEDCTGSLVSGSALCIGPTYTWDTIDAGTALPPASTTAA